MSAYADFNRHIADYSEDSDSMWGIPALLVKKIKLPRRAIFKGFRRTDTVGITSVNDICHFFTSDEKIQSAFSMPEKNLDYLKNYYAVLEPNYSVYMDAPLAVNVFNVYRTRWCGRYWQENGLVVIPTVTWGLPNTYSFCFDGVPRDSVVAIRPPKNFGKHIYKKEITEYLHGLEVMQYLLKPKIIISFGVIEDFVRSDCRVITLKSLRKDSSTLIVK